MFSLVLSLLAAEPTFIGGVAPQPLSIKPMPVDETPTGSACSTETLRRSTACHFDARPAAAVSDADKDRQAKDNLALAEKIGRGICQQRNATKADASQRVTQCAARVRSAVAECDLEGTEALIDTQGRFSTHARGCYSSLAEALQVGDVPTQEAPPPATTKKPRSTEL